MEREKMMNEKLQAIDLANRVLDRVNADPDDDIAILARQFLRAIEKPPMTADQESYFAKIRSMVTKETVCAKYSDAEDYFYIHATSTDTKHWPRLWLSVRKFEGPIDRTKKEPGIFSEQLVEFSFKDGTVYHRKYLPFNSWKVRADRDVTKPLSRDSDEFKDYVVMHIDHYDWPDAEVA